MMSSDRFNTNIAVLVGRRNHLSISAVAEAFCERKASLFVYATSNQGEKAMNKNVRTGKVISERGKIYLESDGERWEMDEGMILAKTPLENLIGQEVEVFLSEPKQFVVGLHLKRELTLCYVPIHPTCYIPIDRRLLNGLEDGLRINLANQFLEDGLISEEVHAKLVR